MIKSITNTHKNPQNTASIILNGETDHDFSLRLGKKTKISTNIISI